MTSNAKQQTRRLNEMPPPSKRIAIVVPLSSRPGFNDDERQSMRHLKRHLDSYDTYMLAPNGMEVEDVGYEVLYFDEKYFGSGSAHAGMQMAPEFYETFIDYEYILMYHLDVLVFSDQLIEWCDKGWDYIGAPWLPCEETPWVTEPEVGNSGFALFNVRNCLRVLHSPKYTVNPVKELAKTWASDQPFSSKLKAIPRMARKLLHRYNSVTKEVSYYLERKRASDLFWSRQAKHYVPSFRVANYEDGLAFAFETEPRHCFEQLGHLPFGCHAFERYDRAFWEPYMIGPDEQGESAQADESTQSQPAPRP